MGMGQLSKAVSITLDRERTIKYEYNNWCDCEEYFNESIFSKTFWGTMSARKLRALLYYGLLPDDPSLTMEQVGNILGDHMKDMGDILAKVTRAVELFMPDAEGAPSPLPTQNPNA